MTVYVNVLRTVLLMLCVLLMCSCADSVGDGVLIVPSSHTQYEETSAVITDSAETEVGNPQTESSVSEDEFVLESDADIQPSDTEFDVAEQAGLMFEDAVFCGLLEQFGEQMDAQAAAVAATLAYQQIKGNVSVPSEDEDTVFWTVSGSVWHVTAECSALAKSKSVLSGSEGQAKQAGKTRVCKRCGS